MIRTGPEYGRGRERNGPHVLSGRRFCAGPNSFPAALFKGTSVQRRTDCPSSFVHLRIKQSLVRELSCTGRVRGVYGACTGRVRGVDGEWTGSAGAAGVSRLSAAGNGDMHE